jgi:Tol biopolymer transport system component
MKRSLSRRFFFWFLVLLFIITVPLIIFYAVGYRFSPSRGIFIYGGSITIKSNPSRVDILIDGEMISKNRVSFLNNSYHISGINPGEHLIEVKTSGFRPWTKKAAVSSGVSSEFWNVLLARENYSRTGYQASGVKKYFISPESDKIALVYEKEDGFSVAVLDIGDNIATEIFSSSQYSFSSNEKENIEWNPNEERIIIPSEKEGKKYYFVVELKTKNAINLKDVSGLQNLRSVRWDSDNKNIAYFIADGHLYSFNLENREKLLVAENVSGFDVSSGYIYYLQLPSAIIYRADTGSLDSPEQITTSSLPLDNDNRCRIIAYDEKRIAVINDQNGRLFIYNKGEDGTYLRELSSEVRDAQFSDDGKKLLFWSDREIFVYFNREWKVQPARAENETKNITRFSENLKNVRWSKDYEHIVFSVGNKIKIIELDHRDHRNVEDIVEIKTGDSEIVSDFSNNKLYFTDLVGCCFDLFSIEFPEKVGFLGG